MKRSYQISFDYLYIPVCVGHDEEILTVSAEEEGRIEKFCVFSIPVDQTKEESYEGDYLAEIPVREYKGKTFIIEGNAPESFFEGIFNADSQAFPDIKRPGIHFTAERGWINDPNGLTFDGSLYHLYYQTNPFDIRWKNMSWGHAVSSDLLHWRQQDLVMLPDEEGEMFSGCGMRNDGKLPELPDDALLFCYTVAGGFAPGSRQGKFVQKLAFSTDGGRTLRKMKETCIPMLDKENRDPFIFRHEETDAYVMILYLRDDVFGIFRSKDMKNWEMQQELSLEGGYECPLLFDLDDRMGEKHWFIEAADGRCFPGKFDGYHFSREGAMQKLWQTDIPYASQLFSGTDDRKVLIPWLRIPNDGRLFTGAMGIPVELTYGTADGSGHIYQRPVREFYDQLEDLREEEAVFDGENMVCRPGEDARALYYETEIDPQVFGVFEWEMNGTAVRYDAATGELTINEVPVLTEKGCRKLEFVFDDRILEIFFDEGRTEATLDLMQAGLSLSMKKDRLKAGLIKVIR